MLDVRFQPMTTRPKWTKATRYYIRSPFKGKTPLDDLERELQSLEAIDIVIESGHDRTQIRNDGWPRGGTAPKHADVRLYFECKHGHLRYECNNFDSWEANLRAISLWLQRQRLAIEEWGIGSGGEAYRGFAALPAGASENGTKTEWANAEDAARWMVAQTTLTMSPAHVLGNPENLKLAYREAASRAHPDTGGDTALMAKVNRAKDYIDKHH